MVCCSTKLSTRVVSNNAFPAMIHSSISEISGEMEVSTAKVSRVIVPEG